MSLTKKQLESLVKEIHKKFIKFRYEALGERALTEEEISLLTGAGLLRRGVRHMVLDPSILGKLVALLPPSRRRMTYGELLDAAKRLEPELSGVEKKAIEYATEHAGEFIRGIEDIAVKATRTATTRASMTSLRAVQEGVKEAIAKRQTISELKTELFGMLDDRYRDWQRVAHTEINTAIQQGIYREIREKSDEGEDQLVYKLPSGDACKYCKKLFLKEDGITPRIFRLRDLADNNFGLKAASWRPTISSVHPNCHCALMVVPKGYDFVKRRVASDEFEHEGNKIKLGQLVDDDVYSSLSSENKDKIREQSILSYTGITGARDTE